MTVRSLSSATLLAITAACSTAFVSSAGAQQMGLGGVAVPREHAAVVEAYGGLYNGPTADYVAEIGARVAQAAGQGGRCGFHVVNTDVVNAFTSPPGCHVYVTRGLVGLLNSEDELAAVLGHEVGHVTANHAGKRQQRSTLTGLGAVILGAVTGSNRVAGLANQFGQLNVLSYSRGQELQSDQLAVRYLMGAGYSPYALADVIVALQGQEQLKQQISGRDTKAAPAWAQTHPLHGDRIQRALQQARASGREPGAMPERDTEYLARLDGMLWGDDPQQGFVEGRRFVHPQLGIGFEAPAGFTLTNGSRAVTAEGPGGLQAIFSSGRLWGDLEAYAHEALRGVTGQSQVQIGRPQLTRVNGLETLILPARAQAQGRMVELTVAVYAEGPETAYHFVTLAPAGQADVFNPMLSSFRRLNRGEMRAAQPRTLQVIGVRPGDTVRTLAARMMVEEEPEAHFRLLNGLGDGEGVRPGQRVKVIGYQRGAGSSAAQDRY